MKAPAPEAFSWERAFKQAASHLEGAGILAAGFWVVVPLLESALAHMLVTDQEGSSQ